MFVNATKIIDSTVQIATNTVPNIRERVFYAPIGPDQTLIGLNNLVNISAIKLLYSPTCATYYGGKTVVRIVSAIAEGAGGVEGSVVEDMACCLYYSVDFLSYLPGFRDFRAPYSLYCMATSGGEAICEVIKGVRHDNLSDRVGTIASLTFKSINHAFEAFLCYDGLTSTMKKIMI